MARIRTVLVGLVCLALMVGVVLPRSSPAEASPTTIYVPDHYSSIQTAVDAADPGDTIIVRDGIYTENVDVNRSLSIRSENGAEVTIVQAADPNDHVLEVTADNVTISGLKVTGATGTGGIPEIKGGIYLASYTDHCHIYNNIASANVHGIALLSSVDNTISGNTCNSNNHAGVYLSSSSNNIVSGNTANSMSNGIYLHDSNDNVIYNNTADSNGCGIRVSESSGNAICNNAANSNEYGILLGIANDNTIYLNNFIHSITANVGSNSANTWNSPKPITYVYSGNAYTDYLGNYWSDYAGSDADGDGIGETPYSIDGDNDNYPLMEPFENYGYTPNPYGYDFVNRGVLQDNPGTASQNEGLTEDSKWTIFRSTFDLAGVDSTTQDYWVSRLTFGEGGNCYGMAASSVMEYRYPDYDLFLENQGILYVSDLVAPSTASWCWPTASDCQSGWDGSGNIFEKPVLKHIVEFQISEVGVPTDERIVGTQNVLNELRTEFPSEMYILAIYDQGSGHALVPFLVETVTEGDEYRVSVYDSNHPNHLGRAVIIKKNWLGRWYWQYDLGWTTWSGPSWWGIFGDDSIELIPISVVYNEGNRLRLPGTGDAPEAMVFLSGEANLFLTNSQGNVTGFINDSFVEEIPNVELVFPLGILPNEEPSKWEPTFYVSNDADLRYTIEGFGSEEYTLLKLGSGYTVEYSAAGSEDITVDISNDGTDISISAQQGEYSLVLNNNIDGESMTFTGINIPTSTDATHQYTVDWEALSQGEEGVTLQIDSDGDGVFEETVSSDGELTHDEFILQTATVIDFDPDVFNLESKGKWVTAYIELPTGYDVGQIDVWTISLNGAVPALAKPTELGDYDSDGIPDLMVKFDRSEVQNILNAGDNVEITITGEVGGIFFEDTDTIRVIDH